MPKISMLKSRLGLPSPVLSAEADRNSDKSTVLPVDTDFAIAPARAGIAKASENEVQAAAVAKKIAKEFMRQLLDGAEVLKRKKIQKINNTLSGPGRPKIFRKDNGMQE